jgi:acetyl-CoA carboxylase biotin carboxyl carrier protein
MRFGRRHLSRLVPDPELVRHLAELLAENGLTEIEYAVGDRMIRVSRAAGAIATAAPAHPPRGEVPPAPPADPLGAPAVPPPGAVTAPMVGTVYLAPEPGAPAFVRPGDTVEPGRPLLIIEAMKVMNEIKAPRAGRVVEILVEDSQPVEYGTPLLLIE